MRTKSVNDAKCCPSGRYDNMKPERHLQETTDHDIVDGHLIVTQETTRQPLRIKIVGERALLIARINVRKAEQLLPRRCQRCGRDQERWFYDLRAQAPDDTANGLRKEAASNLLGHKDVRTTRCHYQRTGKSLIDR